MTPDELAKHGLRVLVCGGREWTDIRATYQVLDRLHKTRGIDAVIEGDARGADRLAGYWAQKNSVDLLIFRADWDRNGKAAGSIRNQQMLDEGKPDMVVAFPGGRGTADMIRRAKRTAIPVWQPMEGDEQP